MQLPWRSLYLAAVCAAMILTLATTATPAHASDLTFEQRVEAQRAIERVYYSHQIGASRPFDEAIPRALLEKKVRAYLDQTDSLERIWKTPVTAEALRREKARIEAGTRLPERLQELYAALGNDRFLIQETLVRAALVDRLARGFGSQDGGAGWSSPPESFQPGSLSSVSSPSTLAGGCAPIDTWDNGILDDVPSPRSGHTAVWTGTEVIIWGGTSGPGLLTSGSRYDPVIDDWRSVSTLNAPSAATHTAVWTGTEMIVWGRVILSGVQTNIGGLYDPASDTWAPVSTAGAPPPRSSHTAIWGDGLMVVWGGEGSGSSGRNDGGRYDPVNDTWTPISQTGAPAGRSSHTAIWTGDEMIVWGGISVGFSTRFDDGARYDPAADTWQAITTIGAPAARIGHTAVWTGVEMIVWGGNTGSFTDANTGGRYDPSGDSWTPTSTSGAPDVRQRHTAVWTGSRMIVWGGVNLPCCDYSEPRDTGGLYDPATDTWTPTSLTGVPAPRDTHIAVWTGSRMIVWGGQTTVVSIFGTSVTLWNSGGRYDPSSDTWTPTSTLNAPPGGGGHSTVWTGSLMIDWGGTTLTSPFTFTTLNAGGRYDPALDAWTPTSSLGAPSPRSQHTAAWTGGEMIVWGGSQSGVLLSDGARYDPAADSWSAVSNLGAPTARSRHTAVWADTRMIVWGGSGSGGRTNTGALYDPNADAWTATSVVGAPTARSIHTSIWTGNEMVVWGGTDGGGNAASGGRYDPLGDSWLPTSPTNAPSRRSQHTAIWTGSRMIVWGGATSTSPFTTNTGGLYVPEADVWTVTSTTGAPVGRGIHTAVWTGKAMVVWGGSPTSNTGGRYDPGLDSWLPTSTVGAPAGRSGHSAVWTGDQMLIWGGTVEYSGGRYNLAESPDDDMDGFTVCEGDCDDSAPSVHPGAIELPGNSVDENCDGTRSCNPVGFWRTRGHFAHCVANDCHRLVDEGLMTNAECAALIRDAVHSGVGGRQRSRGVPKPLEP